MSCLPLPRHLSLDPALLRFPPRGPLFSPIIHYLFTVHRHTSSSSLSSPSLTIIAPQHHNRPLHHIHRLRIIAISGARHHDIRCRVASLLFRVSPGLAHPPKSLHRAALLPRRLQLRTAIHSVTIWPRPIPKLVSVVATACSCCYSSTSLRQHPGAQRHAVHLHPRRSPLTARPHTPRNLRSSPRQQSRCRTCKLLNSSNSRWLRWA